MGRLAVGAAESRDRFNFPHGRAESQAYERIVLGRMPLLDLLEVPHPPRQCGQVFRQCTRNKFIGQPLVQLPRVHYIAAKRPAASTRAALDSSPHTA